MSATTSAATGKLYGVQRVYDAWEIPRSSFYARKARLLASPATLKRGPKTAVSDDELLALIREDLTTSLFTGEGHRKVWGRIRFVKGIKVSRKRVLRIMREQNLPSPHRVSQGCPIEHTGSIITAASTSQIISRTRSSSGVWHRALHSYRSHRQTESWSGSIKLSKSKSSMAAHTATSMSCGLPSQNSWKDITSTGWWKTRIQKPKTGSGSFQQRKTQGSSLILILCPWHRARYG